MEIKILKKEHLKEISELANRNMKYDVFTPELMKDKCFGGPQFNEELNWVAIDADRIVGFLIGAFLDYEKGKFGWIKLMAVEQFYKRKKIGTQLLTRLENNLRELGATELKVMSIPFNYYMPGLDPRYTDGVSFLLRNGFEKTGENINMDADLYEQDFITAPLENELAKSGIIIKRAEPQDLNPTLEFIRPIWKSWEYEVSRTFHNKPISLHISIHKGKVVAFSAYDGNNKGLPWFGPMGTDPSMRGKRLGEILLKRCLADQKVQGHRISIIPWAGPIAFYSNTVNAKISRVFWTFKKNLTNTKG